MKGPQEAMNESIPWRKALLVLGAASLLAAAASQAGASLGFYASLAVLGVTLLSAAASQAGAFPPTASFRRLCSALVAAFGACCGCLAALVVVHLSSPLWRGRVDKTNMLFFLLSLVLGTAGAFFNVRWHRGGLRRPFLTAVGLLAWLLLFKWAIYVTLETQRDGRRVFLPVCVAGAGLVLLRLADAVGLVRWRMRASGVHPQRRSVARQEALGFIRRHVLAWLGLTAMLWPFALGPAPYPFNLHRVSFCMGPALYQYGHELLPGPDLFSQYGLGQGFFFAPFLADTAQSTVDNFYAFYVAVNLAFFLLAYHFLTRLLNSRAWAFFVCVLAAFFQFYAYYGALHYSVTPSVGAFRMPFVLLVGWLFVCLCHSRFRLGAALWLVGAAVGLSVFWSTDTGLACWCACLCSVCVLSRSVVRAAAAAATLTAAAAATFLTLSAAAYGVGALSLRYLASALGPWLWYTGGELRYTSYPWEADGGYFFTLVALVCAVTVIASLATRFRACRRPIPFAVGGLVFLGFLSLFLHAKFAVMPIFGYWAGTGLPALAVMAWVVKEFSPPLYRLLAAHVSRGPLQGRRVPQVLAALTGLVCWAWLSLGVSDNGAGAVYGLRAYWRYGSLLNTALQAALAKTDLRAFSSPPPPPFTDADDVERLAMWGNVRSYRTEADIELIRRNTEPGERIAIVSWYDWAFLLEAKRPPRYFILPVPQTSMIPSQMEDFQRATKDARVLFVDKRPNLLDALYPKWRDFFYQAEESDNLLLYRPRR